MNDMRGQYDQEAITYQMLQQMTPEEQQRFLYEQQMAHYSQADQYNMDEQNYNYQMNQQMHPGDSYRSGNDYNQTPVSKYSVHNHPELAQSMHGEYNEQENEEEEVYESSRNPSIYSSSTGKNDNFKVIIRVRPPLPREQDDMAPFRSCIHITPDNKSISLMEYMGAEVNEAERQIDIQENPQLCERVRIRKSHLRLHRPWQFQVIHPCR